MDVAILSVCKSIIAIINHGTIISCKNVDKVSVSGRVLGYYELFGHDYRFATISILYSNFIRNNRAELEIDRTK